MSEIRVSTGERAFYTPESLAARLNVSPRQVWNLLTGKDGSPPKIASYKVESSRRIDPADVDRYLATCKVAEDG